MEDNDNEPMPTTDPRQIEIDKLQKELRSSDYKILKAVEGYDIPDIASIKAERKILREKISQLRAEMDGQQNVIKKKV